MLTFILSAGDAVLDIPDNISVWLGFALAALEVVFRIKPTARNYSLLDLAHKILNILLPNRATEKRPWEKIPKKGIFGITKRPKY